MERTNTQTYFLLFKGLSDCSANVPEESYEAQEPQDEHKRERITVRRPDLYLMNMAHQMDGCALQPKNYYNVNTQ